MLIISIKTRIKLVLILFVILILFNVFIYKFDEIITPTILATANAEMKAKVVATINSEILNEYSKNFNYEDVVKIEKDVQGNIVMLKADTLKLNKIACNISINSQKRINEIGHLGINIPSGYIFKNNILAYLGPNITVKMQPISDIQTEYISKFEGAGINQTRHSIYVVVKTNLKVILPMKSDDIEIKSEVPISETIIVGKIPDTSIQMDFKNNGFKIPNTNKDVPLQSLD